MRFVSVEEMRQMDKYAIEEYKIAGYELMERAGRGVAEKIVEFLHNIEFDCYPRRRFIILAGKGNNGGDAYVVARYLSYLMSYSEVIIYSVCNITELGGDALINANTILHEHPQIIVHENIDAIKIEFEANDIVIDGLLGTGLNGTLREPYSSIINLLNSKNLITIAIDLPSGMNGDNGFPIGYDVEQISDQNIFELPMLRADLTVTIGAPKWGLIGKIGAEYCGHVKLVDIGLKFFDSATENEMIFSEDIVNYFKRPSVYNHKNSVGRVLCVAGSKQYPGAAFLGALTALRGGAGFVNLAVPESANIINNSGMHSLVMHQILDNETGVFSGESVPQLATIINNVDAIIIGSGITTDTENIDVLEYIRDNVENKAVIYDADALNLISQNPDLLLSEFQKNINILTPHVGEMNRLLDAFKIENYINLSRIEQAVGLAQKTSSIIVLKGHHTVIAIPEGKFNINSSGSVALATAGTGDCLAGIIGAFTSKVRIKDDWRLNFNNFFMAASMAVFIHGFAAEIYPYAKRSFVADDLLEYIPQAMKKLSFFA